MEEDGPLHDKKYCLVLRLSGESWGESFAREAKEKKKSFGGELK